MRNILMTRALDENGNVVDIKNSVSGKACNCFCIDCAAPLWARKGKKLSHFFAHEPSSLQEQNCSWSPETEIHILAKEIIEEDKILRVPIGTYNPIEKLITLDKVLCEVPDGRRIPDITAFINGEKIFIEIAVTHFCDEQKILDFKNTNATCLEIDLSDFKINDDFISKDELRKHMQECPSKWVSVSPVGDFSIMIHDHNRKELKALQATCKEIEKQHSISLSKLIHEKNIARDELKRINETIRSVEIKEIDAKKTISKLNMNIEKAASLCEKVNDELMTIQSVYRTKQSQLEEQYYEHELKLKDNIFLLQSELTSKQHLIDRLNSIDQEKYYVEERAKELQDHLLLQQDALNNLKKEIAYDEKKLAIKNNTFDEHFKKVQIELENKNNILTEKENDLKSHIEMKAKLIAHLKFEELKKEKQDEIKTWNEHIKSLELYTSKLHKHLDEIERKYKSRFTPSSPRPQPPSRHE